MNKDLVVSTTVDFKDLSTIVDFSQFENYSMDEITEELTTIDVKVFFYKGMLLKYVKENKRYEELGYSTFDEYYSNVLHCKKAYAYRLIKAAEVYHNLSTIVDFLPTAETQLLPLTRLEPEQQLDVWQEAAKDSVPTAKVVQAIVDEKYPKPEKKKKIKKNVVPPTVVEDNSTIDLQARITELENEVARLRKTNSDITTYLIAYESKYGSIDVPTDTIVVQKEDDGTVYRSEAREYILSKGCSEFQKSALTKGNPSNEQIFNMLVVVREKQLQSVPPSALPQNILNATKVINDPLV